MTNALLIRRSRVVHCGCGGDSSGNDLASLADRV